MPVKNVCECPDPPGGSVHCEPHQMAICGVINGVERRECLDPPPGLGNARGDAKLLVNWAWSQISGELHMDIAAEGFHALGATNLSTISRTREFTSPNGDVVKFLLPERVIVAVLVLFEQSQVSGSDSDVG